MAGVSRPTHIVHRVSILIILLLLSACRIATPAPTTPPPPDKTYTVDQLRFRNPAFGFRFRHLDACARQFAEEKGLDYLPYYRAGSGVPYSSLMASWCRKDTLGWCITIGSAPGEQEARRVEVSALLPSRQLDQGAPADIFSIAFKALYVPANAGWVAELDMATGETPGDACVRLTYFEAGAAAPSRVIGLLCHATYTLPDRRGGFAIHGQLDELARLNGGHRLARLLETPESLRELGIRQYQSLLAAGEAVLEKSDLAGCEEMPVTPQAGTGDQRVAPVPTALPCTPRPLGPQERNAELERLRAYVNERIAWLQADYAAMYAALEEAFPFAACWLSE
ncbi:MAG: hypothetical protein RMN25_02385 [Anaerolineae bacterium]|nr:hypothetical protein [Thermoflexales bacterium]MDW8406604.1 hypothetical protein [Anaerolineae bacterium]